MKSLVLLAELLCAVLPFQTGRPPRGPSLPVPVEPVVEIPGAPASPVVPSLPRTASPSRKPARKAISVQFSGTNLREVVQAIARYSGLEVVLTPGARGSVSISLKDRDPETAIAMAAAAAGYAAENVDGVWVVGPLEEVKATSNRVGETEVIPLRYRKFDDIAALLSKHFPTIQASASPGALVVTGMKGECQRLREFVAKLDTAPVEANPEREVVAVKSTDPAGIALWLASSFPDVKVTRQGQSLALVGQRSELDSAVKALGVMDASVPPQKSVAVVALQYLNAEKAADVLRKAVPEVVATAGPEPIAPPQAVFNPLAGGFAGNAMSGGMGGGAAGGMGGGMAGGMAGGAGGFQQAVSRATRLVLVGPPASLESAKTIIAETDVPQPMVRIEAGLYEVSEESMEDAGFFPTTTGDISFRVPAGTGLGLSGGQVTRTPISINSTLRALVAAKKAKLLAEPNISAIDNEDASIFIGDLIRFRGSTFTPGNGGAVQGVDAIPIGIALLLRPRIHPSGEVTLKVHPVVSSATSNNAEGLPQTSSREADTTVRLRPGEELVIGGLDRSERQGNVQRVPVLGDIPLVGNLFRGRTERINKNRIVVVIRAYPLGVDQANPKTFGAPGENR